jgi:hypothetical protein
VKTICVARDSRILSGEQMSRHSDFATDGKKQLKFVLVRADLEFSHSLDPFLPVVWSTTRWGVMWDDTTRGPDPGRSIK